MNPVPQPENSNITSTTSARGTSRGGATDHNNGIPSKKNRFSFHLKNIPDGIPLRTITLILLFTAVVGTPQIAHAYVGPGAGFAFIGSAFAALLTVALGLVTISLWPINFVIRKLRGKGVPRKARARRVVIVGLDGLDPKLVDSYIAAGRLPHMKALRDEGAYHRLGTTTPALSPVAWSSFQTGVNPGAHNIFDFLTRDKRHCLPELASTKTTVGQRTFGFGFLKWTRAASTIKLMRMSKPFWRILGDRGIFSNIIRVPISYPPEKFNGNILSAMCTPDLRGTQGSFSFFTTRDISKAKATGGWFRQFKKKGDVWNAVLEGPAKPGSDTGETLTVEFQIKATGADTAELRIQDQIVELTVNKTSEWVQFSFYFGRRAVPGIARFCLREIGDEVSLYISPLNIDPSNAALPISHPILFSQWLAKKHGLFGTLGLMEDTWGRNETVLDDQRFLDQTYLNHDEREQMFLATLDRTIEGLCVGVFDASDRIQHMFWRYIDEGHPSPLESSEFRSTIPEMYDRMDKLVGDVRARLNPNDLLIVLSDHGFASFRRGINLNTWLYENGLLALKNGKITDADYFADVDWSKTKAFAVGLTGIYLNRVGRESNGIVAEKDVAAVKQKIIQGLTGLIDPKTNASSVRAVYDSSQVYRGLYAKEAPDLILGYENGYRVSWECVTGALEEQVFTDNVKAWSGDHHVDPKLVPGILFSNRKITVEDPHITDIAPTVLTMFSVPVPSYMEGRVII